MPAGAITNDWVEDFEHPFVGLVVFYDEDGEFSHRCSGSLVDSRTFLTAGQCTDGATTARVYFQQDAGANYDPETQVDPVSGYPETCVEDTLGVTCAPSVQLFNDGFDDFATFPNTGDVGIVILDQPIVLAEYGELSEAGILDSLAAGRGRNSVLLTVSGYGLSESNPVHVESYRERLMASSTLTNLNSALNGGFNLQTNGNGNGFGGTCSGDSGGPVFLGDSESNLIVAVTSFGLDAWCRGADLS
ncbi:MAG: trypsin-like serine protease [Actinomycetota bacterium]|nr:trypsin-like serine protease [Actinomycetota bacterium]